MATFLGDARRHVEEILRYVSLLGDVALVDLHDGTLDVAVGADAGEPFVTAARSPRRSLGDVVMLDDRTVVGAVGAAHALVLRGREPFSPHAVAVARVTKACLLLNRMLPRVGPESGSGSSGAAAVVARRRVRKASA